MRLLLVTLALLLIAPLGRAADPPKKDKDLEEAVNKALAFLKNTQRDDGSWSAGRAGGRNAAITGLCVMAFLSAGHVPGEGPYAETVEKGIRAVLKAQQQNGLIASEGGHEMYHHGICTIMLAEAAGMTEGPLADGCARSWRRRSPSSSRGSARTAPAPAAAAGATTSTATTATSA
jgi:hypothetical protein